MVVPLLILFSCCTKGADNVSETDSTKAQTISNVSYGTDVQQKMDVYLPANRSIASTKTFVLIHGGGWSGGDKAEFSGAIPMLKQNFPGYAIMNVNYRLYNDGKNTFPTQENDIKAAIQFIHDNENKYFISNDYVFIGTSAGAHLALLQGYKNNEIVKPKAIIDFYGPTDLVKLYEDNMQVALGFAGGFGGKPMDATGIYVQSSPVNFVKAGSPPTLILQGAKDNIVLPSQAETLYAKLQSLGVPSQIVVYPDAGHGWGEPDLSDSYRKINAFVKTYVGN